MELSLYIAKILAVVFLIMGLGTIINKAYFSKLYTTYVSNLGLMLISGIGALLIGMILILNHNIWVLEWYVVITLIGWISLLKGIFLILLPKATDQLWGPFIRKSYAMPIAGTLMIIVGLFFGYFSFVA